ncbi:MAG: SDR family oxidoreductase, partial [Bdellovibrionaceae bacterium]|nr:SDR family oxidoreductase [Pseudobdellovibrionaceae bacterium]
NVLRLASELEIPIFINTSSVAAAINSRFDQVRGMDLDLHRPFPDPYSESKARAEKVIQNWNWPIMFRLNLRLGVLVGDSEQGRIERIDGPYHAAEALRSIRSFVSRWPVALPLPGSEETVLPLVPVDACARAIVKLTEWAIYSGEVGYKSLHLTPTRGVGVRDFYRSVLRHLHLRPKGLILTGRLNQQTVKKIANWAAHLPEEELNYLMNFPNYDTADTEALLGSDWCPEFPDYERVFWSGYEKFVSNR